MRKGKILYAKLCRLGTDSIQDELQKMVSITVNRLALAIAIINSTIGVASSIITYSLRLFLGVGLEVCAVTTVLVLNYHRKHRAASLVLYLIVSGATFYFCCVLGTLADIKLMIVFLIGAAMFFFRDRKTRAFCISLVVSILVLARINDNYGFIKQIEATAGAKFFLEWATNFVIMYLVYTIFMWYWRINDILRSQIEQKRQKEEEKNRTKDRFIANASHEMRVSFRSIFAIINILFKIEDRHPTGEMKEGIKDLRAACEHSNSIVDNVFDYERTMSGQQINIHPQLANVEVILQGIVETYSYMADEKDVRIRLLIAPHVPKHVICDEMKLRQIVTNLLHNAIKFTRNHSTVTVAMTQLGRNLILSVEDQGPGVAEDIRQNIFDPFVTKNPDGLGLGLYIVRELLKAQDGIIDFTRNESGGATFTATIPVKEPTIPLRPVVSLQ